MEHALFRLQDVCCHWLEQAGLKARREGHLPETDPYVRIIGVIVPNFVADLWELIPEWIRYTTSTDIVDIIYNPEKPACYVVKAVTAPEARTARCVPHTDKEGRQRWSTDMRKVRHSRDVKVRRPLPKGAVATFGAPRAWSVRGTQVYVWWDEEGRGHWGLGHDGSDVDTVWEVPS